MSRQLARLAKTATIAATESAAPKPAATLACIVPPRAIRIGSDKTDKAPVTPGPLAPARELYGQMLLAHGKAQEALAAFEATKAKEPNRYLGYAGAAAAAEKAGDEPKARDNYQRLLALAAGTRADRPELAAAKKYLARN